MNVKKVKHNEVYETKKAELLKRLAAETDKNSFDVSVADNLCELLGPDETGELLTADQKEIVIDYVEMTLDCSGFVSKPLMTLYKHLIKIRAAKEEE